VGTEFATSPDCRQALLRLTAAFKPTRVGLVVQTVQGTYGSGPKSLRVGEYIIHCRCHEGYVRDDTNCLPYSGQHNGARIGAPSAHTLSATGCFVVLLTGARSCDCYRSTPLAASALFCRTVHQTTTLWPPSNRAWPSPGKFPGPQPFPQHSIHRSNATLQPRNPMAPQKDFQRVCLRVNKSSIARRLCTPAQKITMKA